MVSPPGPRSTKDGLLYTEVVFKQKEQSNLDDHQIRKKPVQPKVYNPVQPKVYNPVQPKVYNPVQPKVYNPVQPKVYNPVQPKVYNPIFGVDSDIYANVARRIQYSYCHYPGSPPKKKKNLGSEPISVNDLGDAEGGAGMGVNWPLPPPPPEVDI